MGVYDLFGTDKDAETRGVWIHFGGGIGVHVRRSGGGNKDFKMKLERLHREKKRQLDLGVLDDDDLRPEMVDLYASTVLIGWKGITGPDGKEIPFNKQNAVQVLMDLPEFFDEIRTESGRIENFRSLTAEETGKNSQKS
jgi:hypothetical protein